MGKLISLILFLILFFVSFGFYIYSDSINGYMESRKNIKNLKAEERIRIFDKCMDSAAKISNTNNDSVHKIISECNIYSYYISNMKY